MKALEVYRNLSVPELRFQVMQVVRQNNITVARGTVLNDGTRTAIPTATLLAKWELEK